MSLTDSKLVNLITNHTTKLEKIMIKNDFPLIAFTKVLLRKCLQDVWIKIYIIGFTTS